MEKNELIALLTNMKCPICHNGLNIIENSFDFSSFCTNEKHDFRIAINEDLTGTFDLNICDISKDYDLNVSYIDNELIFSKINRANDIFFYSIIESIYELNNMSILEALKFILNIDNYNNFISKLEIFK